MRQAQFDIAIRSIPIYYAVFRVSNFPEHKKSVIANYDLLYWNTGRSLMFRIDGNGMGLMISPDYLRFESYMTADEMRKESE